MRKLIALLLALAMLAAACGGDDDSSDDSSGGSDTASEEASGDTDTGDDDGGDDGDDGAMDDDDDSGDDGAMEEEAPAGGAGEGGELVLLQWQAPSQANSLLSAGTKDLLAGSLVLEPLAEFAPDGSIIPALAAEIPSASNGGISDDLTQITWKLQDGIMWSDGTPLTADDVVFSYEYCIDENTGCSNENFNDVTSVVADDDLTVTVTFEAPKPFPFTAYVSYASPIIQRAQFADCVGEAAKSCADQNFMPIGTGPYMVTELRPEDTVTYDMNPNYRGVSEGKPFFGSVTIKGGGDAEASARSVLEIGEADYGWNLQVAPEIIAPMEAAGNGRTASAFASNVEHLNLNQTDPDGDPPSEGSTNPFFSDDDDLHKALSIAINRQELVDVGYGPTGRPTCNMWPVGAESSTANDFCLTQDIDGANKILDDAGYLDSDGDGVREKNGQPLEFDMVTSTNGVRQSNQELIKAYWAEIGVKANILNEDASLFFDGTCASDACIWKFFTDIEMFTNGSTTPDGVDYMSNFESDKAPTSGSSWGGDNIVRINSPELDALSEKAAALAIDDPARADMIKEMNDIVSTKAIIPLIHRASASAFANSIKGTGDLNGWDSEYYNVEDWFREG